MLNKNAKRFPKTSPGRRCCRQHIILCIDTTTRSKIHIINLPNKHRRSCLQRHFQAQVLYVPPTKRSWANRFASWAALAEPVHYSRRSSFLEPLLSHDAAAQRVRSGKLRPSLPLPERYLAKGCITVSTDDQKAMIATRKGKLKWGKRR